MSALEPLAWLWWQRACSHVDGSSLPSGCPPLPGSREIQEGDKVEPLWCMSDLQVHHGVNGMIFWTKGGWGGKGSPAIDDGDNGGPWGEPHREQKGKFPEGPASWGGKSLLFGNQQAQLATSTPIPGHRKIHSFPFLASSQLSFCLSVLSNSPASPQPQ